MEEVWKDINLATLNEQTTRPITTHSMNLGGVMFQDFLGNIDPPNTILSSAACPHPEPSPPPPLVTALSLSSRPPHHFHFDSLIMNKPQHPAAAAAAAAAAPSNLTNHTLVSSVNCKRYPEPAAPDCALGDRRNKRMIKNRESAARSRARKQEKYYFLLLLLIFCQGGPGFFSGTVFSKFYKRDNKQKKNQAYTNELELEVEHLKEENARLRRQQQQLSEVAANEQKKKGTLYRASTAPF